MNWVAVSGGADSTAVALLMWERGEDFKMIFADTGAEFPETYHLLPRLMTLTGKELKVVSNGGFFQWLVRYGFLLPSIKARWCTRILKIEPQEHEYEEGDSVAIGYRADEPKRVAKLNRGTNKSKWNRGGIHQHSPIAEAGMGKKDVKKLCSKHGLLNPVYQWRTNVSCFCCPFQRKADWIGMLENRPELYAIAELWEDKQQEVADYIWSHWRLRNLRQASEAQLKLFPEPEGKPCSICMT